MASKKYKIPTTALTLGLGGLVPFLTSAAVCFSPDLSIRAFGSWALAAYGAVILSFLGGIKWGILLNDRAKLRPWKPIVLSIVPSLIAWSALLTPAIPRLLLLVVGFVLQYYLDQASVTQKRLPVWYGKLRLILTCGAVASLAAGLLAIYII